jgi:HEAT repeat protein
MKENSSDRELLLETFSTGTPDQKIEAINNLNQEGFDEDLVSPLANLLSDEDKGVRNAVTMFILANRNPKFPQYIVPFVAYQDISVRNLAGEILINLGQLSVEALTEYNHENNDDNMKFVVDVLGMIGDPSAAIFTMNILSTADNDNVILACIEALGNLRYEGAVEILMLFYDRNELYKPTIVEALGKIGSKSCLSFLIEKFDIEDEVTKYSILESLGNIGDIETYFYLLELVNSVNGPLVLPLITSISMLMEKYGLDIPFDNRTKNLLLYTMAEGTLVHKKIAFNLIEDFNDKDILSASLKLLGDDYELDEMIKSKIFRNPEFLFSEISRVIHQNQQNMRQVLSLFLQIINYSNEYQIEINNSSFEIRNIVHSVSGLLNHSDEEVRRASMEILFNLDVNSALLFADTMVNDENSWNRIRLIELIENVNDPSVEVIIKKFVEDEDEMVRDRATFVLNSKINQLSTNAN